MRVTEIDLAEFLLARIAEDEERALRAPAGPWRLTEVTEELGPSWFIVEGAPPPAGTRRADQGADRDPTSVVDIEDEASGRYFERFDPARVLAECEAKRRIVERVAPLADSQVRRQTRTLALGVMLALAQPYADHEGFQEAWRL